MAEEKKRGGGPKTSDGKARSSQNSLKHGGRAQTLILPDESQDDYDRIEAGWRAEFEPDGYQEERLLEILVRSDWFFQRTERRWMEAEADGADQHQLDLLQRYKTTTERSFWRAWQALRGLRKDLMRLDERNRKLDSENKDLRAECQRLRAQEKARVSERAPQANARGARANKKSEKLNVLEQWVEVSTAATGETVTKLSPTNEKLQKIVAKRERIPDLVYRRLFFVGAVPPEYAWTTSDARTAGAGGLGTQRMVWERWLEQIAKESVSAGGHLLPCGGNLPRPKERGGCECPVCTENQHLLKAAGFK